HAPVSYKPRVLSTRGSARQQPLELVDEAALRRIDLRARRGEAEPLGAVDLGKGPNATRAWRPFEIEGVALDSARIAITLDGPGIDDLAAGLPDGRQRAELASDGEARLLGELALRPRQQILARRRLAFRDRPGAGILLGPERAAGMHQEHFRHRPPEAVEQHACALLSHRRSCFKPRA